MQPDERSELRERQRLAERQAELVPGKAGKQHRPQPFAEAEAEGQREHAQRPVRPNQPGDREADAGKQREPRRQSNDAERQRPGVAVGVDQKGGAQPPQRGEEIPETPPPADPERRARAGPPGDRAVVVGRSVDQPDGEHQGDHDRREKSERRHRQRADRPAGERKDAPLPAPGQDDSRGERDEQARRSSGWQRGRGQGAASDQTNQPADPSRKRLSTRSVVTLRRAALSLAS